MTDYLLTTDLSRTVDLDPQLLLLQGRKDSAEAVAKYQEGTPEAERPKVSIGYLPAPKVTEFRNRLAELVGDKPEDDPDLEAFVEVYRQIARWGVKGWNLKGEFKQDVEHYRGREVEVASWEVLDELERRDWLGPLAGEILTFNTLREDQKKS